MTAKIKIIGLNLKTEREKIMAVEGVNNSNNNAGLYALGAATIGAGAGAGVAYMTKPFLKDDAPTDSFLKKMDEKIIANVPENERVEYNSIKKDIKLYKGLIEKFENVFNNSKTIDEFKASFVDTMLKDVDETKFGELKASDNKIVEFLNTGGLIPDQTKINEFKNIKNLDELKVFLANAINDVNYGMTLEEIKSDFSDTKKTLQECENEIGEGLFKKFWDADKKKFINCDEGVGKAIKSAAKSIQGKYALIYGSIAAGVLGIGTYLATMGGKSSAPEQKVDAQA